eukprot:TRINITY_DN83242_c0_g1_i1.p1 TRINITY_DN83242_c0_g1~~TRINITY_DN83242_c0_g1_i1.p1  ORF type:complete len:665 (+),score=128.83 TRINITY_DN83242_c0_g1_i1:145-2139(+)
MGQVGSNLTRACACRARRHNLQKPVEEAPCPNAIETLRPEDIEVVKSADEPFANKHDLGLDQGTDQPWFGPTKFLVRGDAWTLDLFMSAGGMGQTYMATHCATSTRYILKFLLYKEDVEIDLLRSVPKTLFDHPNIVKYSKLALNVRHRDWKPAKHIIFMELVPNGELLDLILNFKNPLSEGTCRRFVRDLVGGLSELCRYGITHRDLKPENLLLDDNGRVVIIDFGHAKQVKLTSNRFLRTQTRDRGTPVYRAPEAIFEEYDSELADVWTVGIILFFLMVHHFPFAIMEWDGIGTFEDVKAEDNASFWRKYEEKTEQKGLPPLDDDLVHMLNTLWQHSPQKRPTLDQMKLAIESDPYTLKEFPGLRWLAGPLSPPLDFVRELRKRRPKLVLRCAGIIEALVAFVREQGSAQKAFQVANKSEDGRLTVEELASVLHHIDPACTEESTAELMRLYTKKDVLNAAQFNKMATEWQSGVRPIVHQVGYVRRYAYMPARQLPRAPLAPLLLDNTNSSGGSLASASAHLGTFVQTIEEAFQPQRGVSRVFPVKQMISELLPWQTTPSSSRLYQVNWLPAETSYDAASSALTATMMENGEEVCQLRLDVSAVEDKIVIESRLTCGSSIDELRMVRLMNEHLVRVWGDQVDVTSAETSPQSGPRSKKPRLA